jgi:cytosine/adenosine deaminase-related metal-dependent hydrolase
LRLLAAAQRALVIHGNYLDDEERDYLARHRQRLSLVYCPRTHQYFGHAPYPLEELLARGVRVVLGTDSRASNPDLSLGDELRFAAARHPTVSPQELLRGATLDAATALGLERELGSLTVGKLASFIALPLPEGARHDPWGFLSDRCWQPRAIVIRGQKWDGELDV